MHTTAFMHVSQGERSGGEKKEKKKKGKCASITPAAPVYIYNVYTSLVVNMFTRKPAAPSQKLTLKPVNNPFTKFINVKEGTVFPLRQKETKGHCH